MKKIVRQQNYLKELIEAQDNRYMSVPTLKCLVRSVLQPLLDAPEDGVVLQRINNKDGLQGLLKRLEFSEIKSIDYTDNSGNLKEKVWANTEFIAVLTHRYVAIIIWDNNTSDENLVRYYSLYNSKLQNEALDIINRNSQVDLSEYQAKFTPDRRDNVLLNASFRKLLENLEDAASDAVLGYAEKSAESLSDIDYVAKKSRVVAHELKNQLSICDLYVEIINRYTEKEDIDKDAVKNALSSINKAIKMANNSLLALKTDGKPNLTDVNLNEIVELAVELSKVYMDGKGIDFQIENTENVELLADKEKLTAVIINLVKNAVEAFEQDTKEKNGKYIKIKIEKYEEQVQISISDNACGIENPDKIFEAGFSTKSKGNGLGLWICKKSVEEMNGELVLERSTDDYTEFVIKL